MVLTTSQQYQVVPGTEVSGRRTFPVAPSMASLTGPWAKYQLVAERPAVGGGGGEPQIDRLAGGAAAVGGGGHARRGGDDRHGADDDLARLDREAVVARVKGRAPEHEQGAAAAVLAFHAQALGQTVGGEVRQILGLDQRDVHLAAGGKASQRNEGLGAGGARQSEQERQREQQGQQEFLFHVSFLSRFVQSLHIRCANHGTKRLFCQLPPAAAAGVEKAPVSPCGARKAVLQYKQ